MAVKSRIAGVIVGALLLVAPLSGCGADGRESVAPESGVPSAAELDNYRPGDLAFFNELKLHGALTFAPPADLAVAAKHSTAVVVAEVVDVRHTRTIVGDTPADQVPKIGVVLRPVEVLHGKLRAELGEVVVEFILPEGDLAVGIAAFRAHLPKGKSVWFLHWLGAPPPGGTPRPGAPGPSQVDRQLYGLISMQGVFVQGADRAISAVADGDEVPHGRTMQADGERFGKLSELAAHIRDLD